MTGRYYSLSVA